MHGQRLVWGAAALVSAVVIVVAWIILSPGWAVTAMNAASEATLGRSFSAKGGAHLDFSPLSIRIDDATLSGTDPDDSFITAKSITIPVSLGQFISRTPDLSTLTLTDAEIALVIDEEGRVSWGFAGGKAGAAAKITLEQATVRYFDARNKQSLVLTNVDGLLAADEQGKLTLTGSGVVNSRVLRIDAALKSLARVNQDGSPFDVALSTDIAAVNFSGMVATRNLLNLAGTVNVTSPDPARAVQWLGVTLPEGAKLPAPLNIDGALDSAGRAFAIHNAAVTFGALEAGGEVAIDLRGERLKLQGSLTTKAAWLDPLVPASGAAGADWGRTPLPFSALKDFDAELTLNADTVHYGPFTAGASKIQALLKDGRLETNSALQPVNGGNVRVMAGADASVLPPTATLKVQAEAVEAGPLITAATGLSLVSGTGAFSAELSARGQTQEEMLGTLKGVAAFTLGAGKIAGADLPSLANAVREKILDGWGSSASGTAYTALTGSASIADGIATFRTMTFDSPQASFAVTGTVDLLRRAVDLKVTASTGASEAPLLPVPITVKGKWEAPRIYPDVPQILEDPASGYSRLKNASPIVPPGSGN